MRPEFGSPNWGYARSGIQSLHPLRRVAIARGDSGRQCGVEARKVVNAKLQTVGSDQGTPLQINVLQDYADSRISIVCPEVGAWPLVVVWL